MTEPLALYIHWPFCLAKCPYCDFNSHVRDRIDHTRFGAALRTELRQEAARIGPRPLGSIFFGGGTPSLMTPDLVTALIEDATGYFPPVDDIEITLEANPTSVEAGKLAGFRASGVNRLSLGVQSLNAEALRMLGRQHDVVEAKRALELARELFPRLSFDLIYARPDQTEAAWRAELAEALALAGDHLSLYQLTIEPGTQFEGRHRRGEILLPEGDHAARLYEITAEAAAEFGLKRYEISNYAKPGHESRHNLAYWRYADYLGIGPGAHQRLTLPEGRMAESRHRAPEPWAELVERQGVGTAHRELISPQDAAREMLLMGLRLAEGISIARFEQRTGIALDDAIDQATQKAAIAENYLVRTDSRLTATDAGLIRLDALLAALVA